MVGTQKNQDDIYIVERIRQSETKKVRCVFYFLYMNQKSSQSFYVPSGVLLYRLLHEQAPKAILFTISCPPSMLQHILNQNPIPPARILHKHMGHRPGQLSALYDGRTAHE